MTVSEPEDTSPVVDGSVLASEETRTRRGALRAVFFALVVFIAIVALMPNKTGLTWTLLGIYTAAAVALLILIVATRHRAYGDGTSTVIGLVVVVLVLGSCVYFGLVGGPTVILPAIVYYYGLGDSKTRRRVVAAVAILGYLALSALVVLHVVPPTGMIPSEVFLGGRHVIFTALSVATLLVVTYWLSSRGRRNTLLAMAELERARRGIRQRDALLHEARDDLDRALLDLDNAKYALEKSKRNLAVSLENLRTFPCIRRSEREGHLQLRGAFFAISDGVLHLLDEPSGVFSPMVQEK